MSMRLRPFGRTGLMISPLTLGSMEFGSKVDPTEASRLLDRASKLALLPLTPQTSMPRAEARKLWGT
jgi:hypothetical protein